MHQWNRILFLSVVSAIGVLSASLCGPALPAMAQFFSTDFSVIQFTIGFFLVGSAFGQFFSGPLSDRWGQRKVLFAGLFLYLVASIGCALSNHVSVLLLCRFFQGMGSSVGPVLARAIAAGGVSSHRSAQVQSYGAMGMGVASMLAIFLSGYLTLISWRGNFFLAAGLGLLLLFWAESALEKAALLPQRRFPSLRQILSQMVFVLKHPRFYPNALTHAMTYGLMYGYISLFPFLLIELFHNNDPVRVGVYSAYMIAFYLLGAFLASRLVIRLSSETMARMGVYLQLSAGALLFIPSLLLPALFLFNLGLGILLPTTSALALSPFSKSGVGSASSVLGLTYRLLGFLISTAICQFPLHGGKGFALAVFLLSLLSLGIVFRQQKFLNKEVKERL